MDEFLGWFGIEDDPDSGIYDQWGTGGPGDYSPGMGNRWIERNTSSDDVVDLAGDSVNEIGQYTGRLFNTTITSALGVTPLTVIILAGAGYLIYKKAVR
tara:strand:- start:3431 stop:3727 length:297 start_codon:yes stop_codon:yes gene_type:complete